MNGQWFEVYAPFCGPFRVLVVTGRVAAMSLGGGSYVNIGDLWSYASARLSGPLGFPVRELSENDQ